MPAQKDGQQRTSKRSSDSPNISANGVGSMTVDTSSIDDGGMYLLHVQSWYQAQGSNLKPTSAFCKHELSEPRRLSVTLRCNSPTQSRGCTGHNKHAQRSKPQTGTRPLGYLDKHACNSDNVFRRLSAEHPDLT